jgi:sugar transferase (PEP-CTERM system associated)
MAIGSGTALSTRRLALILGESVVLLLVCGIVTNFREILDFLTAPSNALSRPLSWSRFFVRGGALTLVCQVCFTLQDLYDWRVTSNPNQTSIKLLESIFYAGVVVGLAHYALNSGSNWIPASITQYSTKPFASLIALIAVLPVSHAYRLLFHWVFARWQLNDRVVLVGSGSMAHTLVQELQRLKDPGYELIGFVTCDGTPTRELPLPALGPSDELAAIATKHRANRVAVALDERRGKLPILELLNCRLSGMRVEEGELLYERLTGKIAVQRLRPSHLVFAEGFTQGRVTFAVKRAVDLVLAVTGLLLTSPVWLLTAIAIKLDSPGPIFFGQTRVGRDGRIFTIWKFRSMRTDAEKGGPQWAAKNDARITRVGRLIRSTRIDELPQLWNVLRNEMAVVGPRPERPFFVDELRKKIPYYMERLLVKPGLTGWAQINYQYGSSVEDALTKLQYDLYYIKNLSIWLDLLVVLRTVKVIVLRRGAN